MATFYLDPTGGNDANDGTTFANRWKTITSGATAARIAAGDIIRIMASPDPTSLGQNATFTNKSDTVTLTSAVTANVTVCDTVWTAATNVTASTDTSTKKEGTAAITLAIASGFTTGKAGYFAISSTDFSSYQQLSFWIRVNAIVAANTLSIKLCSDTTGDTAVDTFSITHSLQSGRWYPITINKGSALGSAIQSVALYCDLDPGTVTVHLDNILACKATSSNDSLTLNSLIGKNTAGELWYPIASINGTTVKIDSYPNLTFSTTRRGYAGTTATTTAYKRECHIFAPTNTFSPWGATNEAGSSGSPVTFSGGWDRTNMSTQTGDTYIDGLTGAVSGVSLDHTFQSIEKLYMTRFSNGITGSNNDASISNCGGIGCESSPISLTGQRVTSTGTIVGVCSGGTLNFTGAQLSVENVTVVSGHSNGTQLGSAGTPTKHIGTTIGRNCTSSGVVILGSGQFNAIEAYDNGSHGVSTSGVIGPQTFQSIISNSNTGVGWIAGTNFATVNSLSTTGNTTNAAISYNPSTYSYIRLKTSSYGESSLFTGTLTTGSGAHLQSQNDDGTGNHITYVEGGTISSDSGADRHTASGLAWKLSPTSTTIRTSLYPLRLLIATVVVNASSLVTVKGWVKRSASSTISARIVCPGGQIAGVSSDVTATASAGSGTYEELTITFTPSEAGAVEIYFEAWGGTTASAWIDDLTITQA